MSKMKTVYKAARFPVIVILALVLLYTAVLLPIYHYFYFDTVMQETVWFDVIDVLAQWAEPMIIFCIFGFLIHAAWQKERKALIPLCAISAFSLVFKYVFGVFTDGWSGVSFYFPEDLWVLISSLLIELGMIALTVGVALVLINRLKRRNAVIAKASRTLGKEVAPEGEFYPFRRVLNFRNPLQLSAFLGAVIVLIMRTVAQIMDIISDTVNSGVIYTSTDLLIELFYWALLILIPCLIGYFVVIGFIRFSERCRLKVEAPSDNAPDVKAEA